MYKIMILQKSDIINPEKLDQSMCHWETPYGSMQDMMLDYDFIIFEGRYLKNRLGNLDEPVDLNKLLAL